MASVIPLPWERLLWSGRPARLTRRLLRERYHLTDFRLVAETVAGTSEIALQDIVDVARRESRVERLAGTSTVVVQSRLPHAAPVVLHSIRRGASVAAALELLAADPRARDDRDAVRAALHWEPRSDRPYRQAAGAVAAVLVAIAAVVFGLHGRAVTVTYSADDAIAPNGVKRPRAEIAAYMEHDVLPWARRTLARIKGGEDRIT